MNAFYLLTQHFSEGGSCLPFVSCSEVLQSSFSTLFGVPIASIGLAVYAVLTVLYFLKKRQEISNEQYRSLSMVFVIPSAAVSLYLAIVQQVSIGAWCYLCLLNTVIFVIAAVLLLREAKERNWQFSIDSRLSVVIAILAVFLLPITAMVVNEQINGENREVATIAGAPVYLKDIDRLAKRDLDNIQRRVQRVRKQFIDQAVLEYAASKKSQKLDVYLKFKLSMYSL